MECVSARLTSDMFYSMVNSGQVAPRSGCDRYLAFRLVNKPVSLQLLSKFLSSKTITFGVSLRLNQKALALILSHSLMNLRSILISLSYAPSSSLPCDNFTIDLVLNYLELLFLLELSRKATVVLFNTLPIVGVGPD